MTDLELLELRDRRKAMKHDGEICRAYNATGKPCPLCEVAQRYNARRRK